MQFTKMHGIGNDFVIVDALGQNSREALTEAEIPALARKLCDRKFGIGADGLLLVLPSEQADFTMRMWNPDGSEAEMCGNGIRCFARYLFDRKRTTSPQLRVETPGGIKTLILHIHDGQAQTVQVDMGEPHLTRAEIPMLGDNTAPVVAETLTALDRSFAFTALSMGNPHVIIFLDSAEFEEFPVAHFGPAIEHHPLFPQRTNVHFVQIYSPAEVRMKTWERGAGQTLACGTGACAVVVASALNNKTGRDVLVHLPGGDLQIVWHSDNRVLMTGPAEFVFDGVIAF